MTNKELVAKLIATKKPDCEVIMQDRDGFMWDIVEIEIGAKEEKGYIKLTPGKDE